MAFVILGISMAFSFTFNYVAMSFIHGTWSWYNVGESKLDIEERRFGYVAASASGSFLWFIVFSAFMVAF